MTRRPTLKECVRALLISFGLAVFVHLLEYQGCYAAAEGRVADVYLTGGIQSSETLNIVTVAIDDGDYEAFFDASSPLDPASLLRLVASVQDGKPAVIGVDILTDSTAYTDPAYLTEKQLDLNAWQRTSAVPVVWAAGIAEGTGAVQPVSFLEWMNDHHEELHLDPGRVHGLPAGDRITWGVPVFPSEHDRSVRRLSRHWRSTTTGGEGPTFAGEIARKYCELATRCSDYHALAHHKEVFVTWDRRRARENHHVRDLFECTSPKPVVRGGVCEAWQWRHAIDIEGAIVILGGTFGASRDFFATPLDQRTAGLIINAHAVQSEILGPPVGELSRRITFVLDVVVGLVVSLFIFGRVFQSDRVGWRVALTGALGVAAAAISYFVLFPRFHILWLSWIAMLLTGLMLHIAVGEAKHLRVEHH
jgi:CHASE2 domain-containing sensor protein